MCVDHLVGVMCVDHLVGVMCVDHLVGVMCVDHLVGVMCVDHLVGVMCVEIASCGVFMWCCSSFVWYQFLSTNFKVTHYQNEGVLAWNAVLLPNPGCPSSLIDLQLSIYVNCRRRRMA